MPILLSLFGPAYFGYRHSPYWLVVAWAAACAAGFFWMNRPSLYHAFSLPDRTPSFWFKSSLVIAILTILAVAFLAVHSLIYYGIGSISSPPVQERLRREAEALTRSSDWINVKNPNAPATTLIILER
jgi:drug/metabolite transporter (DMT)-like permease